MVVSHHGPHLLSVHPRYAGDATNAAFVSDTLDDLLSKANLWVHGHVHDSFDYTVRGCRIVANPCGYAQNRNRAGKASELLFENPVFQWACVIDVSLLGTPESEIKEVGQVMMPHSGWICAQCAKRYLGSALPPWHTLHFGTCGFCNRETSVTSSDDFSSRGAGD